MVVAVARIQSAKQKVDLAALEPKLIFRVINNEESIYDASKILSTTPAEIRNWLGKRRDPGVNVTSKGVIYVDGKRKPMFSNKNMEDAFNEGLNDEQMGHRFGVSDAAVFIRRRQAGLQREPKPPRPKIRTTTPRSATSRNIQQGREHTGLAKAATSARRGRPGASMKEDIGKVSGMSIYSTLSRLVQVRQRMYDTFLERAIQIERQLALIPETELKEALSAARSAERIARGIAVHYRDGIAFGFGGGGSSRVWDENEKDAKRLVAKIDAELSRREKLTEAVRA